MVKNPPANTGDVRNTGSIPVSERSPGGGHSNPLQYFCLQNPVNRGPWQATVHRVSQSQTRLKRLSSAHTAYKCWLGLPWDSVSKEYACNAGEPGSIPRWGRSSWRRKWQPTPVFLPGKSRGQRSLASYSPWAHRVRHNLMTKHHHDK